MKNLLFLIFLLLSAKNFAQFSHIEFYPNDSLKKMAISFNQDTIYCLGYYGSMTSGPYELFKSIDKGHNWSLVNQFDNYLITNNFISFSDSVHISASKSQIIKTDDAFDSLKCIICNNYLYPTTIEAVNQDTILIYDNNRVLMSYDRFVTWDTIDYATADSKHPLYIDELSIINDSVWIANLRDDCTLIKATNAGANWQILKDFSNYSFCDAYIFSNFYTEYDGVLYIKGSFYLTHDGAQSFSEVFSVNEYLFEDMKFFSSGWFYVLTVDAYDSVNTIYYSKNYGTSWDSMTYDFSYGAFLDLRFFNDTLVFVNTCNNNLLKIDMTTLSQKEISRPVSSVKIFPNPTSDILNIEDYDSELWEYKIYDQFGQLIKSGFENKGRASINLQPLMKGFYYIEVIDLCTKTAIVKKLIKI